MMFVFVQFALVPALALGLMISNFDQEWLVQLDVVSILARIAMAMAMVV